MLLRRRRRRRRRWGTWYRTRMGHSSPKLQIPPDEAWEVIRRHAVIPAFDPVIELPGGGILLVRRRLAPYQGLWALPGLRMHRPESVGDTLRRIARDQAGLEIDTDARTFLGQYVGRFRTEFQRHDLSTGYHVRATTADLRINANHFTGHKLITSASEIPANTGAMYRYYLDEYFRLANR
jgi:ADP-ribose pyrophosphatase YjhB (NUDIX family)